MSSRDITIRTVPSVTNPTPRPCTPGRPGTSAGMAAPDGRRAFNVFDSEEPVKSVFDDMITAEYLQQLAGTDDLRSVTSIKLIVDTNYQSLLDIGDMMRGLEHLTLDGSKISSVRDLGSGLKFLTSLSINDCGLSELDGIGMLTQLKELSARDNSIEDVTALALHETIESIDLHGNKITDVSVADTLSSCPSLHHLILTGNSIERAPKYRLVVAAMIPQLLSLDEDSVDDNAKGKVSNGMILEAASAMQLEQEELDDEKRMEMEMMGDGMFGDFSVALKSDPPTGKSSELNSGMTGETGGLPDNGSDLTHGSAVVLAGSMASAIRRRRNGSPRASSSHSQDGTTDAVEKSGDSSHEHYFGEGDITKEMQKQDKNLKLKMVSSPKNSQFRSKKKRPPSNLSLEVNSGPIEGSSSTPRSLNHPVAAAIISAAHSQNAMSFDNDEDTSSAQFSSGVSGASPAGWASRPLSRSRRSNSAASRSPSPSTRNTSAEGGRKPPKSPPTWQRNASRPQSSTSPGVSSHGIAGGIAPSAPFKVVHHEDDVDRDIDSDVNDGVQDPRTHQKHLPPSSPNEVLPSLSRHQRTAAGRGSKSSLWDCSSADSDSGDEGDEMLGRNQRRGVGPHKAAIASHTIVKKDNVLRGLLFSDDTEGGTGTVSKTKKPTREGRDGGKASFPKRGEEFSFDDKDDDDDDEEEMATDHKSRHEFMLSKQRERDSSKHKQKQMMTFSQGTEAVAESRLSLHSPHSQHSTDNDIQESSINLSDCIQPFDHRDSSSSSASASSSVSRKQLSEVATRQGFDLKGSLAAINQWVDDQDSDDSEDEVEATQPSKYGEVWSMRNEMKRATTAQKKILSRDKIIGMCTGVGENNYSDAASKLTAGNLAMNGYSSGYSYDQEDDNESDVEENEVMFYDNNVEKTTDNLSKSCSLLTIGGFGDMSSKSSSKDKRSDKNLMSMSMQMDKPPPRSPEACESLPRKRSVKRVASSRKSSPAHEASVPLGMKSRGCTPCTPSTNTIADAEISMTDQPLSTRPAIEVDVRGSPSNDAREDEKEKKKTKASVDKVNICITKESSRSGGSSAGAALALTDDQLVHMLSQPPKAVPTLKTKSGFQDFFRGMKSDRMRVLLELAYKEMTDLERNNKVKKRMELLSEVLD